MEIRLIIALCCVLFLSDYVFAEGENDIKKGHYPFMAFIFYPDETIIEGSGLRFLRGAVLVKPEWLITSSVVPMLINDTPIGFPRKTLLARLGSVSIDANITLNEDEDEQEREVIQLVRPNNHSEAQWWRNDITLLKTLLPFNLTSAVSTATIRTKPGIISNSNCFMLVYAVTKKFGNWTEERVLTKLLVELQSGTQGSCGSHFHEDTMLCAVDSEDNKDIVYEPEYCQGNSGAPLICENEVSGLQTYVENNCKPPHLYQLLSAWDNFITCGIENKCGEEQCSNMCTVVNKDEPVTKASTASTEQHMVHLVSVTEAEVTLTEPAELTTLAFVSEVIETTKPSPPTPTSTAILQQVTKETTASTTTSTSTTSSTTISTTLVEIRDESEVPSWPKEKYPDAVKSIEEDKMERKTNVEAQRQNQYLVANQPSAADRNIAVPISLLSQFILVSLII